MVSDNLAYERSWREPRGRTTGLAGQRAVSVSQTLRRVSVAITVRIGETPSCTPPIVIS